MSHALDELTILANARAVMETESQAIGALALRLDASFVQAVQLLLTCQGHVVITGMGKSGHIGHKIAATLASTGTPSFFVHPAEASHGDLGMIRDADVLVALSNSGETEEIIRLVPVIERLHIPLIAITGQTDSTLAKHAKIHLDAGVDKEACPLGLAPTASTSAQLAMGDALALALAQARGFTPDDFARSHPGGTLGRRLLITTKDVMHVGDALPRVTHEASAADAGMVLGVITDGDLRRHIDLLGDIKNLPATDLMTRDPQTIQSETLAVVAVELMQSRRIQGLLVTDETGRLEGALNFQDLLQAGVV